MLAAAGRLHPSPTTVARSVAIRQELDARNIDKRPEIAAHRGLVHPGRGGRSSTSRSSGQRRAARVTSPPSSTDHESDGTRFHERNKSYAAAVIKACGCTFCHMYKHLKLRHGKEIVRAAHKFIGTFRTPNIKAKTSSLRKWAHMLFWTRHHPADDGWRKLRSRERQYVVACLAVPSTGSSRTRLSFAKHAVEALWRDVEKKEQRG